MNIVFKDGVFLQEANLDPCMTELLRAAARTAPPLGDDTLVVTSAADGRHSAGSLHYVGRAFDIRTLGDRPGGIKVPDSIELGEGGAYIDRAAHAWAGRMRQQLGPDYDVVVEGNHIHAEWDPKRGS